jgi:hypothetical protein
MQHTHVKRKEHPMNRYVMEEFYNDPALRRRLFEKAHLERARVFRLGLSWLRERLSPRFDASRWLARLG